MKKVILATLLLATTATLFTGCKKDSSSGSSFSATIGGTAFNPNVNVAVTLAGTLTISGSKTSGSTAVGEMGIIIENYTGATGTFAIDSTGSVNFEYEPNSTTLHTATSGSVVITAASANHVKGTFSGTLDDGTAVTNGQFDLPVTAQ